jgi:hypothetical protein
MRFDGRCHCGNLEVTFDTAVAPEALPVRECGCTFCRRHGATVATDPAGRLEVRAQDAAEVSRYRFAMRTADFLICRRCGVFVAAVCDLEGATYATLNLNVLEQRARFTSAPAPVSYDREPAEERLARRRRAWTPAFIRC